MKEFVNNAFFWQKVDTLIYSSKIMITKEKNDLHNEYPNLAYPVAYGYLEVGANQEKAVNIYQGTHGNLVTGLIVSVDILKKDMSIKLLVGCDESEEQLILYFLNQTDFQKTVLIKRGSEVPVWAISE